MLTSFLVTRSDFRHIVFADSLLGPRRALNLAPAVTLRQAASGPLTAPQLSFVRWLFARAGLNANDYREETLARRLPACLRALRVNTLDGARAAIESSAALLQQAVDAMIIGVTSFFRDRAVFAELRETILPMLIKEVEARDPAGRIRIWSAGCSSGAELYSIAIVLSEIGLLQRADLLGTDCRPQAACEAAAGVYDASDMRSVPREIQERYFVPCGDGKFRVLPHLRRSACWRTADVIAVPEPPPWDVIFCRNLAMYLRPRTLGELWEKLHDVLRPGGILVLGKAERPTGTPLTCIQPCIFRRGG